MLFISRPYHSLPHLFLLTFLYLTEFILPALSLHHSSLWYIPRPTPQHSILPQAATSYCLLPSAFPEMLVSRCPSQCVTPQRAALSWHYLETFPSGLVREERYVSCREILCFKCPGGRYIGNMKNRVWEMSFETVKCVWFTYAMGELKLRWWFMQAEAVKRTMMKHFKEGIISVGWRLIN